MVRGYHLEQFICKGKMKLIKEELINAISELENDQQIIVEVNEEVPKALSVMIFREDSLQRQFQAIRENRYGFYTNQSVDLVLSDMENARIERENFIRDIGIELLGEDYRSILDKYKVEFRLDTVTPVVIFFRVG